jgi:predicted RNase H-like nuclease (RuvC/YqgF family)
MKLRELLSAQDIKKTGQTKSTTKGMEPEETEVVDPSIEPKKRMIKNLGRQLESLMKQKVQQAKLGRENIPLDKRIEQLKKKMNDIKATIVDELEVKDDK